MATAQFYEPPEQEFLCFRDLDRLQSLGYNLNFHDASDVFALQRLVEHHRRVSGAIYRRLTNRYSVFKDTVSDHDPKAYEANAESLRNRVFSFQCTILEVAEMCNRQIANFRLLQRVRLPSPQAFSSGASIVYSTFHSKREFVWRYDGAEEAGQRSDGELPWERFLYQDERPGTSRYGALFQQEWRA
ncbi:MAG: hypothetical protein Q9208_008518 [Pyrenodesmia sp. 3 TL-2023]